jgi:hypothetical protein
MFKQKFVAAIMFIAALIAGVQTEAFATNRKAKATFKVRIENVSAGEGLLTSNGARYPFALSPGLFTVSVNNVEFFDVGKKAGDGIEAQAEDGNPEVLYKKFLTRVGSVNMGIFNVPAGAMEKGPLLPGGAYEFTFSATEGAKLNLIAMYGQSNDLFYAPAEAIDLFNNKVALTGDITDKFMLWDAGTEVNQAPGVGDEQAPRQKMANTGAVENGVVGKVKDGFSYPATADVLRITITQE